MKRTPAGSEPGSARRSRRRRIRSLLWRARPWVVAALVALAALIGLRAVAPAPAEVIAVVVASHPLRAGDRVEAGHARLVAYPRDLVPSGAIAEMDGQVLSAPVPEGAVVTRSHLAAGGWPLDDGELAVPVRITDPLVVRLLSDGARVIVVEATGQGARVLTEDARVLAVLTSHDAAGPLALGTTYENAPLTVLGMPADAATLTLDASAAGTLTIALPGPGSGP